MSVVDTCELRAVVGPTGELWCGNATGPVWDIVINDIAREERFVNVPENVEELYRNAGQRPAARRRVREYIRELKGGFPFSAI